MKMEVNSYVPSRETLWEVNRSDGSGKARIHSHFGVVAFFTFPGDDRHRAFTTLEMYYRGRVYHATLEEKFYSPRWWRRLAYGFADQVTREAKR